MPSFSGFPAGKVRHTPIPAPFFKDLLAAIDDLAELKVTLYAFWRLDRMEGTFRFLQRDDFTEDAAFMQGLGPDQREQSDQLEVALEKAVGRGTFLKADVTLKGDARTLYFLNSPRGRAAVQGLQEGKWQPEDLPHVPLGLDQERPNIYRLYETHIGPLTPMIAETLRDAEETYPSDWIEEALRIAVENNIRRWRYVEAILRSWQEKGKDERKDRRGAEKDRRKYVEGEFSEFIEH